VRPKEWMEGKIGGGKGALRSMLDGTETEDGG
jgi:hypothetical protein